MKKSSPKVLILVTALLTILSAACSTLSLSTPESRRDFAEAVIENWSGYSRIQAARLMQEYGPPDQVKHAELVWNNKGVWQKIRVWDVTPYYDSNLGAANIEQTVAYSVPMGKRLEVLDFSRDIRISQDGTGISVRGTSEESNFLRLNLADEIVLGETSPEEARRIYARTLALVSAGKSSPYLQGLLFASILSQTTR